MDNLVPLILQLWGMQEVQNFKDTLLFLGSISAVFWLLARLSGAMIFVLHAVLLEEFGSLLAVLYNMVLAVLFSAVIFLCVALGSWPQTVLWREMFGFVFLYVVLGATYMDRPTKEVNAYSWPGYVAGLGAYPIFAMVPLLLNRPEFIGFYRLLEKLGTGRVGWLLNVIMIVVIGYKLIRRGLRELFFLLSPVLWFLGIIRHPPIRVRRTR